MLRDNKGITLIALVVMIIIILIIASVATYSGISTLEGSKIITYSTELKMIQEQVELLNIKAKKDAKINDLGVGVEDISDSELRNKLEKILQDVGISDYSGYRYLTVKQVAELGVDGIEQDIIINISNKEVISVTGFIKDGKVYRTLKQMSDDKLIEDTYKVNTNEEQNQNLIDFNCQYSSIGNDMYNIEIGDIVCSGYVKKVNISYSYNSNTFKNVAENYKSDSFTFQVENEGSYIIKVQDASGNYKIKEIVITN